jgi:catechol-2,3-dioxygenase
MTNTIQAIKLGFIGLDVVDIASMRRCYGDVLGLPVTRQESGEIYLSCGGDHHSLSLHSASKPALRHLGLQVAGEGSLRDVQRSLSDAGVPAQIEHDRIPGVPESVRIADVDGYAIHLYRDMARVEPRYTLSGIMPNKLGHAALYVRDPAAALAFYTNHLGFRWSDWLEDLFVFMRCNCDHHALNCIRSTKRGLFHFAFELRDWSHLGNACDMLARSGILLVNGPVRHGLGHNQAIYFRDPDGNLVELFCDLDRMSDESLGYFDPRPHHEDSPQRPKVWPHDIATGNIWGIPASDDFLG